MSGAIEYDTGEETADDGTAGDETAGEQTEQVEYPDLGIDPDRPVPLFPLVYLDEDDETTLGRADTDTYAVLPSDGAALVRRLDGGATPHEAEAWYRETYGEEADVPELLAALTELGLVRPRDESGAHAPAAPPAPVKWQRLGQAVFSRPAAVLYGLLFSAAVLTVFAHPDLAPHYKQVFFTEYFTVVELGLFLGQFPLMLLHEGAHALAGRRLGLRSRLRVGRRLYFIVFETALDGLVAVERRKRYLPILAGSATDLLTWSVLLLTAAALREPDGSIPLVGRICLALAFNTLLRIVWQFYFYLRNDGYYLVTTVLGCVDLHGTAMAVLRNRWNRLRRRPDRLVDETAFHPVDRRAARWYSWLVVAGYGTALVMLAAVGLPSMYTFLRGVAGRFTGDADAAQLTDSAALIGLSVAQFTVIGVLALRARRARKARPGPRHVVSPSSPSSPSA